MRLLIASEPKLCRNLQVKVIVDVIGRDNVRIEVLLTTCHPRSVNIMPYLLSGLILLTGTIVFLSHFCRRVVHLSQIEHVLFEVGLHFRAECIGLVAFRCNVCISLESFAFFGLDGDGCNGSDQKGIAEYFHFLPLGLIKIKMIYNYYYPKQNEFKAKVYETFVDNESDIISI